MRFCMITTFYPPYSFGGDGVFVKQLSNELARRGHEVEIVCCQDAYNLLAGGKRLKPIHDQDHPRVTVHSLKSPWGFLSPLATHQSGRPILKSSKIKKILQRPFDVIHYHNVSLIGGPAILQYGEAVKVYTLHEYWLICPTHLLFKFNRKICARRHCLPCVLTHRRPPQVWRYTDAIAEAVNHVNIFIAPSTFSKKTHLQMGLKIPIIELPHFSARWDSHEQSAELSTAEAPYFLFVGRLEKIKGLQEVLPLFRQYQRAQLRIVGAGDYEPVLRRLAKDVPNIQFLGYRSGEELGLLYKHAVATIVPSLWHEVFGMVILESFAQRTPVIVRNRGGMPQLVKESGGGFVFDTTAELLSAMERLLENPSLRQRIGMFGYEAFRSKWGAEVHIARYLNIVSGAMAERLDKRTPENAS